MRYLFSVSLVIVALLLIPAIATGQTVYTMCDIWYEESTNTAEAYAVIAGDYSISGYYMPIVVVEIESNGQILASASEVGSYGSAYTSTSAQPDTDYLGRGLSFLQVFYYYNICDYDPIMCYYMHINNYPNYYDAFDYTQWASYCNTFQAVACFAPGPAIYVPWTATVPAGSAWDTVHVPGCSKPTDEVSILKAHVGFDLSGIHYNGGRFDAQLIDNGQIPPSNKYAGRTITESFDMLQDQCYSAYGGPVVLGLPSSSSWQVNSDNKYVDDIISIPRVWIDFYYGQQESCSATLMQIMSISGCGATPEEYERHQCEHRVDASGYDPRRDNVGVPEAWPWPY